MTEQPLRREEEAKPESVDPNKDQRRAAHPRSSVWVAASAGSGKTKVLTDRVKRLLLDGVDPSKILCLTFTRAAAAEMSIRLTRQLAHWATCGEDDLRAQLDDLQYPNPPDPKQIDEARRLFAKVLATPGGMRISTIHSFAQEILRRFPIEAGLQPHFTAMEEAEAKALAALIRADLLHEASQKPDTPEGRALRRLSSRLNEEGFTDALRLMTERSEKLGEALQREKGAAGLGAQLRKKLGLAANETAEDLLAASCRDEAFSVDALRKASALVLEKGTSKFVTRAESMAAFLTADQKRRPSLFKSYIASFFSEKGEGEVYKDFANKALIQKNPWMDIAFQDEIERLSRLRDKMQIIQIAEETEALVTLASAYQERLAARKQALSALDFDDLIARTVALLERAGIADWVLYKLDGGIDHILLDEAQDTSPLQWRILDALTNAFFAGAGSREECVRTLFVVGDEKQSIYSFQGADPVLFRQKRGATRDMIRAADQLYDEVEMTVSFRSAPAILRLVDGVFSKDAVRRGVSDVPVRHQAFHAHRPGRIEIWPIEEQRKEDPPEPWSLPEEERGDEAPHLRLAAKLAAEIRRWIDEKQCVFDESTKALRPIRAGDIMVLLPKRRNGRFVRPLHRALKKEGVPVMGVDRMRLMQELAVKDLVVFLSFLLLPEDDLSLATLLRGPVIGLSEENLMRLSLGRSGSLWASLLSSDDSFDTVRAYLLAALDRADRETPFAFLSRLLAEPCPADAFSGRRAIAKRLGPESQDPLDELLDAALSFGSLHTPSLQAFLQWLTASDAEIKREMDQRGGQVRIMTAHASKGLEAPIVILPDTMSPKRTNEIPKLLWAEGCPFFVQKEVNHPLLSLARAAALQKLQEEHRRLLYVALTRAGERLVVAGWAGNKQEVGEIWYDLIADAARDLHQPWRVEDNSAQLVYQDDFTGDTAPAGADEMKDGALPPLPGWVSASAPAEPSPPRPLIPSRPEDEPALLSPHAPAFARGKIMHTLLQHLPDLPSEKWRSVAEAYLANPQHLLPETEQKAMGDEVLALLGSSSFAPLFGPESRGEVPVIGRVGDRIVSGQIDRLCLVGGEVWIVDYKTNRPPPQTAEAIPDVYRKQLAAYRSVLEKIYGDKRVRCFLLWTHTLQMMELDSRPLTNA